MTNLERIRRWAPDYPFAFSTAQVRDATGLNIGKINGILHSAHKYGYFEYVGIFDGVSWWRMERPEGAEPRPVVFHSAPVRLKAPRTMAASTARLFAWVEALPIGTRFMTADAFEATGVSSINNKLHHCELVEIAERGGRIRGRITWRRI